MTLPIFVATLWQSTTLSVYQWLGKRESERLVAGVNQGEIWDHLHSTQVWVGLAALVTAIFSIYAIAILRWGYHAGAVSTFQKMGLKCTPISLSYFVVTTAAWGLWIGLLVKGIDYSLWHSNGDLSVFFNELPAKYPYPALAFFLLIGLATYKASINSGLGMSAIYANSKLLAWVVGLLPIILLLACLYVLEAFVSI
jgi:hypothetical protein